MLRLKHQSPFPPGGFPYRQTEGLTHNFPDIGLDIHQQGELVLNFRAANKLPRASIREVVSDIETYTCQRLGGVGCFDSDAPPPVRQERSGSCSTCGGSHVA